jgi:hypothetical protein
VPPETPRGERPADPSWRADALAGSRHSRLADELTPPLADFDPERAAALCAQVSRDLLGDYAPALVLLPAAERRRAQALVAYARTLFDFARQRGVAGERLAQINRWEFDLERALAGEAVGQPVFVALAAADAHRPWSRPALAALGAVARRAAAQERPVRLGSDAEAAGAVARAAAEAWLGEPPAPPVARLATFLLRAHAQRDERASDSGASPALSADRGERGDLGRAVALLPPAHRRAGAFLRLAAERLAARAPGDRAAALGVWERLFLLGRVLWRTR